MKSSESIDAAVIGGGFYGASIALYLARTTALKRIVLFEREDQLLKRASLNNQARVHAGYHYPRSFSTAYRSRINFPRFLRDWPQAIDQSFLKVYAVSSKNSKVTARQFERFCNEVGAKYSRADRSIKSLFSPRMIEEVYIVEECAFNAQKLAKQIKVELEDENIELRLRTAVIKVNASSDSIIEIQTEGIGGPQTLHTKYLFNSSYSGLNQIHGQNSEMENRLKHEIVEMGLIEVPEPLKNLGITVMDGPFFSMMPYPARNLHSLSHVRYSPHSSWVDSTQINPYRRLEEFSKSSRVDRMLRDAQKYVPEISRSKYLNSIFEVKTVPLKNESNDGRPILFEKHNNMRCFSILGGKVDNIYDVFEQIDGENFV